MDVTVTRAELVRILAAGAAAARIGRPATDCPYSPGGDANERIRAAAWLRGWRRAGGHTGR